MPRTEGRRVGRVATACGVAGLAVLAAGCGGHDVPDAFGSGVPHGHVLMDRVDCDPAPDACTRYVIVSPAGTSTAALLDAVTRRTARSLGWVPTAAPEVVEMDEGHGYDGPGKTGGYIDTAAAELRFWARVGYLSASPPNVTETRAADLMRAHPDAVVVLIETG
jgi:hypothetical protein